MSSTLKRSIKRILSENLHTSHRQNYSRIKADGDDNSDEIARIEAEIEELQEFIDDNLKDIRVVHNFGQTLHKKGGLTDELDTWLKKYLNTVGDVVDHAHSREDDPDTQNLSKYLQDKYREHSEVIIKKINNGIINDMQRYTWAYRDSKTRDIKEYQARIEDLKRELKKL